MVQLRSSRWLGTVLLAGSLAAGCRHSRDHEEWAGSVVDGGPSVGMPSQQATPMTEEKLSKPKPLLPVVPEKIKPTPPEPGPAVELEDSQPVFHRTRSEIAPMPAANALPEPAPLPPMQTPDKPATTAPAANDSSGSSPAATPQLPPHDKSVTELPLPASNTPMEGTPLPPLGPSTLSPVQAPAMPAVSEQPTAAALSVDSTTIVGELLRTPSGWRLRCQSGDKSDCHGSVVLVGANAMSSFREGQLVRVQGSFTGATTPGTDRTFKVQTVAVIGQP